MPANKAGSGRAGARPSVPAPRTRTHQPPAPAAPHSQAFGVVLNTATVGNRTLSSDPQEPSRPAAAAAAPAAAAASTAPTQQQQQPQQRSGGSSKPLTGQEIEEAAMWKQIRLHEAYPNGRPVAHSWSGKELEAAYQRWGGPPSCLLLLVCAVWVNLRT